MPRSFLQPLVGVLGYPVAENPTQVMIEAAFAKMGLDWRYITLEVAPTDLATAVAGLRAIGFRGFNCTIPHKVAVIPLLDSLSPAAEKIGAVNCVVNKGGKLIGDNTDGKGFLQSVLAVRSVKGAKVVVLGAGGAARAIGVELAIAGAGGLTIVNRDPNRGRVLANLITERTGVVANYVAWEGKYPIPQGTDILVNATSIGLFPDVEAEVPIDFETLASTTLVCDVIPNPPRTRLVANAERAGCVVLDGLGMLVNQGVIGIQLWTGADPDPAVMRQSLESVFND